MLRPEVELGAEEPGTLQTGFFTPLIPSLLSPSHSTKTSSWSLYKASRLSQGPRGSSLLSWGLQPLPLTQYPQPPYLLPPHSPSHTLDHQPISITQRPLHSPLKRLHIPPPQVSSPTLRFTSRPHTVLPSLTKHSRPSPTRGPENALLSPNTEPPPPPPAVSLHPHPSISPDLLLP